MSGWFCISDIVANIAVFMSFIVLPILLLVVLPLLLIVGAIKDATEKKKIRELQIRYKLKKEAEKEFKIETRKKEDEGVKNEN